MLSLPEVPSKRCHRKKCFSSVPTLVPSTSSGHLVNAEPRLGPCNVLDGCAAQRLCTCFLLVIDHTASSPTFSLHVRLHLYPRHSLGLLLSFPNTDLHRRAPTVQDVQDNVPNSLDHLTERGLSLVAFSPLLVPSADSLVRFTDRWCRRGSYLREDAAKSVRCLCSYGIRRKGPSIR